jgi:hypothetical protein
LCLNYFSLITPTSPTASFSFTESIIGKTLSKSKYEKSSEVLNRWSENVFVINSNEAWANLTKPARKLPSLGFMEIQDSKSRPWHFRI